MQKNQRNHNRNMIPVLRSSRCVVLFYYHSPALPYLSVNTLGHRIESILFFEMLWYFALLWSPAIVTSTCFFRSANNIFTFEHSEMWMTLRLLLRFPLSPQSWKFLSRNSCPTSDRLNELTALLPIFPSKRTMPTVPNTLSGVYLPFKRMWDSTLTRFVARERYTSNVRGAKGFTLSLLLLRSSSSREEGRKISK